MPRLRLPSASTVICGTLGRAVAASRLRGRDFTEMANLIGINAAQLARLSPRYTCIAARER